MLKFQVVTDEDRKTAACIQHKRQIEEARKSRILDPKARRIGIDKEFLDKQIAEKEQLRQLEREKEKQMYETLVRSSQLAIMLEKKREEERRKLNKEINDYRQVFQRAQDRREFDLYDPDQLKKSLPARADDDDGRIGMASAQKFEGEDTNQAERLKIQKEQMQAWLIQQVHERRAIERECKNSDAAYQEALVSRERRAMALDKMEQDCRKQLNEANAEFNRKLAEEQGHRRRCENFKDEEDNRAEIYNHVTGDFLTEAKEQAESNRGPHRVLGERYKGMTSDELKAIQNKQLEQMEEIQIMKDEERRINEKWNQLMEGNARAGELHQRKLDKKRLQMNREIAEENLRLAREQKSQQNYLNQCIYKGDHMSEFFNKFNTTAR